LSLFSSKQHRIEQALLKSAVAGNSQASKEVIRLLSSPAYSLAWKMLGKKEDAEDVVQEAFIRLWKSVDKFSGKSGLSTYFYTIVSNLCLDRIKSLNKGFFEEFDEFEHHPMQEIEWNNSKSFDVENVQKAVNLLTGKQRMAMLMWVYQDMTAEQIGDALEMNKNSVDQLLYRAKLKLKTELEKGESHAIER
jgi:RNA polymerase sigma-70 factor, ECF subfamily